MLGAAWQQARILPIHQLLSTSVQRTSIADLQSFASHQFARPGAAPGHCNLVYDPRPMRAERSLYIDILYGLFPLHPSETSTLVEPRQLKRCVILKRVDDAISADDPIRTVIRGTGSNQDGHTKGFTVPSADAQARLIKDVYGSAGLDFSDTRYVKAQVSCNCGCLSGWKAD